MLSEDRDLPESLTHILWIGGTPGSGKTSIAATLAEKYGLEQARANLVRRDLVMDRYVAERATAHGLTLHWVDGSKDLDQMAAVVEAQFAPWLRQNDVEEHATW